jgi:single-strand DNA-binding protein
MYQKIIVVGNLGGDPEMRYMPDGTAVTNFSLATSRRWKDSRTGEQQEETTWFRVSIWGRRAETANQYLAKGRQVLIEGRLRPDENGGPRLWTAQDGSVRASFEINATDFAFVGTRTDSGYEDEDFGGGVRGQGQAAQEEDDIPF